MGYRVHLRHMPPLGHFVRLDVGGPQKMGLLPTQGRHGKLPPCRSQGLQCGGE